MSFTMARTLSLLALAGGYFAGLNAYAEDAAKPSLENRIDDLEQQLKILNRKLEIEREETAAKAKTTPQISAGKEGFALKSADDSFHMTIRGTLQADARWYISPKDNNSVPPDNFVIRRVRPTIEGKLYDIYGFRVTPEFAGNTLSLLDLWIEANFDPTFRVRAGKFKGPIGLERLQSPNDIVLVERAFPTQLVPNRDIGLMVHGNVFNDTLYYSAGIFDGTVDGNSIVQDTNNGKDFEGRLYAQPFKNAGITGLGGLHVGFAYSKGSQNGSSSTSNLPTYLTPGQQNFFTYANGAFADGQRNGAST